MDKKCDLLTTFKIFTLFIMEDKIIIIKTAYIYIYIYQLPCTFCFNIRVFYIYFWPRCSLFGVALPVILHRDPPQVAYQGTISR